MPASADVLIRHKQITIQLLESLGFLINYEKSILIPTQKIQFLGLLMVSVKMMFIVPETKIQLIHRECQKLVNQQHPTIRNSHEC